MNKNCEVIDMSLGGTVVKTAGKAAVAGTWLPCWALLSPGV